MAKLYSNPSHLKSGSMGLAPSLSNPERQRDLNGFCDGLFRFGHALAYYLCASSAANIHRGAYLMKKDTSRNRKAANSVISEGKKSSAKEGSLPIPARRIFLQGGLLGGLATAAAPVLRPWVTAAREISSASKTPEVPAFEFEETMIAELQEGMKSGKHTARSIAEKYLERIEAVDKHGPAVNSVIETNPDALAIAEALDRERKEKGPRGPLHGIPVLIKDNIDTHDRMMTTAGSLALLGSIAPKDSFVAKKLREAGAVILGKTNLSEWANIRSSHSSSGWSGRGGQTKNPYALDRNPCGSSSGSGAAASANLCAGAIGTCG